MKMNKNEYLRSMARHATLLCCIVPFIAVVSAQADPAYSWDQEGVSYTKAADGTIENLEITLTQSGTVNGNTFSLSQFNASSFSSDFQNQLSGIDSMLPRNSTWTLSQVIVEITATVSGSVTVNQTGLQTVTGSGTPVMVGSFTFAPNDTVDVSASTLKTASGNSLVGSWGTQDEKIYDENNKVSGKKWNFSGSVQESEQFAGHSETASFSGPNTGTFTLDNSLTGLTVQNNRYDPDEDEVVVDNVTSAAVVNLSASTLTYNIKYIVTPEPGTMALLLTGIPLFLVRRRKSWKK